MQQLRRAVLQHVRIPVQQTSSNPAAAAVSSFWRGFAGGGYLDKTEVTDRVLHVTKHFEKIDAAKVRVRRSLRGAAVRGWWQEGRDGRQALQRVCVLRAIDVAICAL